MIPNDYHIHASWFCYGTIIIVQKNMVLPHNTKTYSKTPGNSNSIIITKICCSKPLSSKENKGEKCFNSFCLCNESQWVQNNTGPQWLSVYRQKRRNILQNSYSLIFHIRKNVICLEQQKLWQNWYFWVYYPFNLCEYYHKVITDQKKQVISITVTSMNSRTISLQEATDESSQINSMSINDCVIYHTHKHPGLAGISRCSACVACPMITNHIPIWNVKCELCRG